MLGCKFIRSVLLRRMSAGSHTCNALHGQTIHNKAALLHINLPKALVS